MHASERGKTAGRVKFHKKLVRLVFTLCFHSMVKHGGLDLEPYARIIIRTYTSLRSIATLPCTRTVAGAALSLGCTVS